MADPLLGGFTGGMTALDAGTLARDRVVPTDARPIARPAGASVLLDVDGEPYAERRDLLAPAGHEPTVARVSMGWLRLAVSLSPVLCLASLSDSWRPSQS